MDTVGTEGKRACEQVVNLAELFYDLVYVYTIAQMTPLFHGVQVVSDVMGTYILTPFAGLAGGSTAFGTGPLLAGVACFACLLACDKGERIAANVQLSVFLCSLRDF